MVDGRSYPYKLRRTDVDLDTGEAPESSVFFIFTDNRRNRESP